MKLTPSMHKRLQALLIILLAIFLAQKFWSGQLYYYIGPRFSWLSLLAVVLLIAIAGAYDLTRGRGIADEGDDTDDTNHEHSSHHPEERSVWPLALVALPLVLGVVVPPTPLGASAVSTRGLSTEVAVAADETSTLNIIPGERNVLDWARAMSANPDPTALNGQQADVVGFVYRDARFDDGQFMVGRFTITCCVADALAIGLVVESDNAAGFKTDSWVRVTGTFDSGTFDGGEMPILYAESIIPVQQPEQPYLYP